jgi:AcrR family transcriptional regulator
MPYPAQTNRETIVEAARALIEREGAEQISLAQLASALGIKAPSLYRHIASRDALLRAVNERSFQQLFAAYNTALGQAAPDARARLLALCRAHRAFAHANPRVYVLAFSAGRPEQRPDPQALEQLALPIQAIMAELVGVERSLTALRGLLALLHGFVMLELNGQLQRGGDLTAAFEASIAAFLMGWRDPGA